jgi:hypothetical protein
MAKYDNQIAELKNLLPNAKNILIAVPAGASIDKLASALALSLTLEASQKQVSVVCQDTIQVAQSHLFNIDKVKNTLPSSGGDFTLTLEGVAVPDTTTETGWKVPALSTMDYVAENNNLNLIFHVIPGQTFQPTGIVPHFQGSGFNLIITVGAPDLNSLGSIYQQNQAAFSGVPIVNIDNSGSNTGFGQTNVVDPNATSVSEMLVDLIPSLGLSLDADTASNLLAGIFSATNNLTTPNMNADTFMAVANCLRVGGKKPQANEVPTGQGLDLSGLMPKPAVEQPQYQPEPTFTNPPVVPQPQPTSTQPLAPEAPKGEVASTGTEIEAEPDWLTPKIFKAGQG